MKMTAVRTSVPSRMAAACYRRIPFRPAPGSGSSPRPTGLQPASCCPKSINRRSPCRPEIFESAFSESGFDGDPLLFLQFFRPLFTHERARRADSNGPNRRPILRPLGRQRRYFELPLLTCRSRTARRLSASSHDLSQYFQRDGDRFERNSYGFAADGFSHGHWHFFPTERPVCREPAASGHYKVVSLG